MEAVILAHPDNKIKLIIIEGLRVQDALPPPARRPTFRMRNKRESEAMRRENSRSKIFQRAPRRRHVLEDVS
jgi:hypothetical protein